MEAALDRNKMLCAYERVVKNQGAPGVDFTNRPLRNRMAGGVGGRRE